jgi:hypothetical protein
VSITGDGPRRRRQKSDGGRAWRRSTLAAEPMLDAVRRIIAQWRPDVLIHEAAEFTGPLAATLAGIPSVHHSWGLLWPPTMTDVIHNAMTPLWRRCGVEPDAGAGRFRYRYLDICPPTLQSP